MSVKLMGLAWELDLERCEKYVLLCLADHAKDDGSDVYPSVALIMYKTGYQERQVREAIKRLIACGLVVVVCKGGGPGTFTKYQIHIEKGKKMLPFREWRAQLETAGSSETMPAKNADIAENLEVIPAKNSTNTPAKFATELLQNLHTEPLVEPPVETSLPLLPSASAGDEPAAKNKTKPSSKKKSRQTDPRHGPFVEHYAELYMRFNQCSRGEVPWDGSCAGRLKKLLQSYPDYSLDVLKSCLTHRFNSDDANVGDQPSLWMFTRLFSYRNGPLNEFHKPRDGYVRAPAGGEDSAPLLQMSPEEAALREEAAAYDQQKRKQAEREAALQRKREEYLKANGHDPISQ